MPDPEAPSGGNVSELMRKRIQSFKTEPLHSAAYLNDVVRYLSDKPTASARYRAPSPVYAYKIPESDPPKAVSYSQASDFLAENAMPDVVLKNLFETIPVLVKGIVDRTQSNQM